MDLIIPIAKALSSAASTAAASFSRDFLARARERKQEEATWNTVANALLRHMKKTAARLSVASTVAFPSRNVELGTIYIPLTVQTASGREKHVIDQFPTELFKTHEKILLQDRAGMGKSTLSRMLFLLSLKEKYRLPILIDLRRLDGSRAIESIVAESIGLGTKQQNRDALEALLRECEVLYIFDGFDEVSDEFKRPVSSQLRDFIDRCHSSQFVLTSRPELAFSDYTDFERIEIKPLERKEAIKLIQTYGTAYEREEISSALIEQLSTTSNDAIAGFLRNPLLTSLLFRSFEHKSVVPLKRCAFYWQVYEALFESHDLNKETAFRRQKKTGLDLQELHKILRAIAKGFRKHKAIELKTKDFHQIAAEAISEVNPSEGVKPADLAEDLTSAVPLMQQENGYIRWNHKSIMEYFLAEYITRDARPKAQHLLRKIGFERDALQEENLLTLICESEPLVYADALCIPALEALKLRYEKVRDMLPRGIDEGFALSMMEFFAGHEIAVVNEKKGSKKSLFDFSPPTIEGYSGVHVILFGKSKKWIVLYESKEASVLRAPIANRLFSSHPIYRTLARGMKSTPREQLELDGIEPFAGFINSKTSPNTILEREDDLRTVFAALGHHVKGNALEYHVICETIEKLTAALARTRSAQEEEIF